MSDSQYEPPSCSPFDPTNPPAYGYSPSLAAGVVFTVLFAIAFTAHLAQTVLSRRWWLILFATGAAGELLGWIARTWASQCAYSAMAFQIQISTLIFSPAFFAAGIYIILGYLIRIFGPHTSPLSAKQYLWVFCTIDFFSLLLQAVGGGMASAASDKVGGDVRPGTNTMIVGIIFQLAANVVFAGLFASVVAKTYKKGKGILNVDDLAVSQSDATKTRAATTTKRMRMLVAATTVSTLALIVRGIYRSIELLQGWRGYLITTESYFIGLDGALMVIAVIVFVVANPGWLLPHKVECIDTSLESGNRNDTVEKVVEGSESDC
ncbi:MAG: hypothetical protein L6R40_002818 [Gallowayella cf. fulva]|nr:MAG: hypothetical protein L6R40_002818 [Xanthomendoza cf. fulva]